MTVIRAIALLVMTFLAAINYRSHRDGLHPGFMQATAWLIVLSLFFICESSFFPMSDEMVVLIASGVAVFTIGCSAATYGMPHQRPGVMEAPVLDDSRVRRAVGIAAVVGIPFVITRAREMMATGPSDNQLSNLRMEVSEQQGASGYTGVIAYLGPVGATYLAYELYRYISLRRSGETPSIKRLLLAVAVEFVYASSAMGRTGLFLICFIVLGFLLMTGVVTQSRGLLYSIIAGAVIYGLVAMLLEKGWQQDATLANNAETLGETFQAYLLGSLPAFDHYALRLPPDGAGEHVFRFFFAVLRPLEFVKKDSVEGLVYPFVNVPMPTNVYTIYYPYWRDFGWAGVFSIQLFLGLLHGFLYRNARRTPFALYLFVISLYPLAMQFFQDQYFSLFSQWIQYAFFGWICFGRLSSPVAERPA